MKNCPRINTARSESRRHMRIFEQSVSSLSCENRERSGSYDEGFYIFIQGGGIGHGRSRSADPFQKMDR